MRIVQKIPKSVLKNKLRNIKKIWRATNRNMPYKEFRDEIINMHNPARLGQEVLGIMLDKQLSRARSFYASKR